MFNQDYLFNPLMGAKFKKFGDQIMNQSKLYNSNEQHECVGYEK